MPLKESFHRRRPSGPTAVPLPLTREASQHSAPRDGWCELRSAEHPKFAQSVHQRRKLARPPCETFRRNVRGMAGMPPAGGSPDWGIPCVALCSSSAESMSAAEHARDSLRRSLCAAYGAEFFLYEKMGRRAIVPVESSSEAGSTSEVGGGRKRPSPPPPPKRRESKGSQLPLAGGSQGQGLWP